MERRGRPRRVELAEPRDRAIGRQAFDRDAPLAQTFQHRRVGTHLRRRTHPDEQPLGELLEHFVQVFEHQRVPISAPPVPNDARGQDE